MKFKYILLTIPTIGMQVCTNNQNNLQNGLDGLDLSCHGAVTARCMDPLHHVEPVVRVVRFRTPSRELDTHIGIHTHLIEETSAHYSVLVELFK